MIAHRRCHSNEPEVLANDYYCPSFVVRRKETRPSLFLNDIHYMGPGAQRSAASLSQLPASSQQASQNTKAQSDGEIHLPRIFQAQTQRKPTESITEFDPWLTKSTGSGSPQVFSTPKADGGRVMPGFLTPKLSALAERTPELERRKERILKKLNPNCKHVQFCREVVEIDIAEGKQQLKPIKSMPRSHFHLRTHLQQICLE